MRRLGGWGAALVVALTVVLLAGFLYVLVLYPSAPLYRVLRSIGICKGAVRPPLPQHEIELASQLPHELAPNEEVRARGRLKLIASLGDVDYYQQRWSALGKVLEREKVAPMVPFYRNPMASLPSITSPLSSSYIPGNIIRQVPPADPNTPIALAPPRQLGFVSAHVAGGPLAAVVEGRQDWSFPPSTLVIRYGSRDTADEVRRVLVERLHLCTARLAIYGGGKGVLAWVVGLRPEGKENLIEWTGVFLLEAPEWQPKLVADSDSMNRGQFDLAGQNLDGSSVYLYSSVDGGMPYEKDDAIWRDEVEALIWRLDTHSHALHLVCRSESINLTTHYLIASPDGTFLALGADHFMGLTCNVLTQCPVQVVDCRDGSVHSVTWRAHGNYIHSPMAWSADVPGRLYFIDLSENVWQLDIDLSQEGPEDADQSQQ